MGPILIAVVIHFDIEEEVIPMVTILFSIVVSETKNIEIEPTALKIGFYMKKNDLHTSIQNSRLCFRQIPIDSTNKIYLPYFATLIH